MGHYRAIADACNDYGTSDDSDGAPQDVTPFEEVLHKMLALLANGRCHCGSDRIHLTGISGTFYNV
jgi:hypothetical protein